MTEERDAALDEFFAGAKGIARTAGDAVAMVSEHLERLEELTKDAGELDEDADLAARAEAAARVYDASIDLGQICIDALSGLVISAAVVDQVAPRPDSVVAHAEPLDDTWQRSASPYRSLATVALAQRELLAGLAEQPNQLYRRLHETIALAADVAAWSTWSQIGEPGTKSQP